MIVASHPGATTRAVNAILDRGQAARRAARVFVRQGRSVRGKLGTIPRNVLLRGQPGGAPPNFEVGVEVSFFDATRQLGFTRSFFIPSANVPTLDQLNQLVADFAGTQFFIGGLTCTSSRQFRGHVVQKVEAISLIRR